MTHPADVSELMQDETVITPEEIEKAATEFNSALIDPNTFFLEEVNGRKEYLVFEEEDRARLTVYSDITSLQEANKAAYKEPINHKSEFRRIARFDQTFLDLYGFDHGLVHQWYFKKEYMPLLMRLAHDPDYRDFRTMPGHYIRRGQ